MAEGQTAAREGQVQRAEGGKALGRRGALATGQVHLAVHFRMHLLQLPNLLERLSLVTENEVLTRDRLGEGPGGVVGVLEIVEQSHRGAQSLVGVRLEQVGQTAVGNGLVLV